jgi:rubrerythrin
MHLTSAESIRALHYAADFEMETRDYYDRCLEIAVTPGAKEIFRGLVDDERRHFEMVMRLIEAAEGGGTVPTLETMKTEAAKLRAERCFPELSAIRANFSPDNAAVEDILNHALEIEKESFDTYSRAAKDAEEPEVRAVYRFLAEQENTHYVLIDNLISYLDAPGRWLYEEENLIFRR